jgi:hypothetical protein
MVKETEISRPMSRRKHLEMITVSCPIEGLLHALFLQQRRNNIATMSHPAQHRGWKDPEQTIYPTNKLAN